MTGRRSELANLLTVVRALQDPEARALRARAVAREVGNSYYEVVPPRRQRAAAQMSGEAQLVTATDRAVPEGTAQLRAAATQALDRKACRSRLGERVADPDTPAARHARSPPGHHMKALGREPKLTHNWRAGSARHVQAGCLSRTGQSRCRLPRSSLSRTRLPGRRATRLTRRLTRRFARLLPPGQ